MPDTDPLLTVVVPLGPGEREVDGLLAQLCGVTLPCEVILLRMGGPELTAPPGLAVRQLAFPGRRAAQMNEGAAAARGAWLWFLHADTRLLPGATAALAAFTGRDERALGWFRLTFRADGPWLTRLNAAGANWRARWLGVPFGDQGFVLRAADFRALGGFDEAAHYGEDHLFVWTARAAGVPARPVGGAVATSARKYARRGWARTTVVHWWQTLEQAWPAWRRMRRQR